MANTSLVVDIRTNTQKFVDGMNKVNKRLDGFGRTIKGVGALATGFLAGFSIKAVIDATAEQERAVKQLEQAIKSTGGIAGFTANQLKTFAGSLQTVTNFGDEAVISMQSILLTFTNIRGEILTGTTRAVLDLAERMGTDLNSAALQLGKALNAPVANLGALSRAGIQFSDEQKETIKTMVESGHIVDAQRIILKELETQFGGSAEAARDTFGGALKSLNNAAGDLLEADGLSGAKNEIEALTRILQEPATVSLVNALTSSLVKGFAFVAKVLVRARYEVVNFKLSILELINTRNQIDKSFFEAIPGGEKFAERFLGFKSEEVRDVEREVLTLRGQVAQLSRDLQNLDKLEPPKIDIPEPTPIKSAEELHADGAGPGGMFAFAIPDIEAYGNAIDKVKDKMGQFKNDTVSYFDQVKSEWESAGNTFTRSIGYAVADQIMQQEKFADVARTAARSFAREMIASMVAIAAKKAAMWAIEQAQLIATAATAAPAAASVTLASVGTNVPVAIAGMAATAAASQALFGVAHDGLSYVPQDGTYLLQKGEKVVSNEDSRKLDSMMNGGGGNIVNINIRAMDSQDVSRVLSSPMSKSMIETFSLNAVRRSYYNQGRSGGP